MVEGTVSQEFSDFCIACAIIQVNTQPYWPQANGEVVNMNRSLVKRLKLDMATERAI